MNKFILGFLLALNQSNTGELSLPARIVRVHDGDTVTVEFKFEANIRLLNCYAPELKTDAGKESQKFLEQKLDKNKDVIVKMPVSSKLNKSLSLSRFLGEIYQDVDGDGRLDNLSEVMIKNGFAKEKK